MRVCFVSHRAGSAGGERSLIDLVEALSALSVECRVVVPARAQEAACPSVSRGSYGPLIKEWGAMWSSRTR